MSLICAGGQRTEADIKWFYDAQEYADFLDFLEEELGKWETDELREKFKKWLEKDDQ